VIIQVVVPILSAVATPYCAKVRVPVVPVVPRYIVSVVIGIVDAAPRFTNETAEPIGKATELFAGIVKVPTVAM
jgi:hypothetical protein